MRYALFLLACLTAQAFAFGEDASIGVKFPALEQHYSVTGRLESSNFDCPQLYSVEGELQLKEYWYAKSNNNYVIPEDYKLVLKNGNELEQGKVLARSPVTPYDDTFELRWSEPLTTDKKSWVFDVYLVSAGEFIGPRIEGFQESPLYRVLVVELAFDEINYRSTTFEPWVFFTGNESTKDVGSLSLQCITLRFSR